MFVGYVVLGHRLAARGAANGIANLGAAMTVALLFVLPFGFGQAMAAFSSPLLLGAAIGVGICSSVIPYICDQLAMSRLPRASFALMLSLLPLSATLIGVIVLAQIPGRHRPHRHRAGRGRRRHPQAGTAAGGRGRAYLPQECAAPHPACRHLLPVMTGEVDFIHRFRESPLYGVGAVIADSELLPVLQRGEGRRQPDEGQRDRSAVIPSGLDLRARSQRRRPPDR